MELLPVHIGNGIRHYVAVQMIFVLVHSDQGLMCMEKAVCKGLPNFKTLRRSNILLGVE